MTDMSKSKFDSPASERMYEKFTAEAEISHEGHGWWGLYRGQKGGCILHEDTYGFVDGSWYDTRDELEPAWLALELEFQHDDEADEPEDDDYVIQDVPGGYMVHPWGRMFKTFSAAVVAIGNQMKTDDFWPNVWIQSDHGNFHLVTDFDEAYQSYRVAGPED